MFGANQNQSKFGDTQSIDSEKLRTKTNPIGRAPVTIADVRCPDASSTSLKGNSVIYPQTLKDKDV